MPKDNSAPREDARARYYWTQVKEKGSRYDSFDWPSMETVLSLVYTYNLLLDKLTRSIEKTGLSLSAFNAMTILYRSEKGSLKQYEVSDLMIVSRANVTGLVEGLRKKGLVERFEDEKDRRAKVVKITKKGKALLDAVLPGHYRMVKALLKNLNVSEKRRLNDLLHSVRTCFQVS